MHLTAGERYDWECEHVLGRAEQDVPWLVSVARRAGGPVLELACGTGRVTVPLAAQTGLPVVGLDLDRSMLERARRRGATRLVQGDMAAFAAAPRFALVAVPYNSVQLLDPAGRAACLHRAAAALVPGGLLAVECTDFQRDVTVRSVDEVLLAADEHVELFGAVEHDLERRCSRYHRRFVCDGEELEDDTTIWSLDATSIVTEIEARGFTVSVDVDGPRTRCVATVG